MYHKTQHFCCLFSESVSTCLEEPLSTELENRKSGAHAPGFAASPDVIYSSPDGSFVGLPASEFPVAPQQILLQEDRRKGTPQ